MKKKITNQQKQEILALEEWFNLELTKLRKRQLEILKKYDQKKTEIMQKKVLLDIINNDEV